jgi:hypothetical protein
MTGRASRRKPLRAFGTLGSEVGHWRGATGEGKIKRTAVRELAPCWRSRNPCLHIGFFETLRLAHDDV